MDSQDGAASSLRYHGGNLDAARRLFPHAPLPWIDLSTGINPVPYPVGELPQHAWTRLPDVTPLERAAAAAYHARQGTEAVAAPGTQALIQWLPHVFPARRVGVLGFTYSEHAACWRAAGAEVVKVAALTDLAAFDVGVVVNPNNPDGFVYAPSTLADMAAVLARRGGRLIVDEAFMDLLGPQHSLIPNLPAGVVVLRSFGKAYGLAGLRLGFALGTPEDGARLRMALGPWAVSGPAIEIGQRALADAPWLLHAKARLRDEGERLDRMLQSAGLAVVGGAALFRLVRHEHAACWFKTLCAAGILTRAFRERPEWLRFGIPHAPEAWTRLEAALVSAVRNVVHAQSARNSAPDKLSDDACSFGATQ
jgi:cobalamin biosynthetic protein CobC